MIQTDVRVEVENNRYEPSRHQAVTAKTIARAARIGGNTKRYVLRDEFGLPYDGPRWKHVLAAIVRRDRTNEIPDHARECAAALLKSIDTGRMNPTSANRITAYSPYRLCALVARIATECSGTTIYEICDLWIGPHHAEL